MNPIQIMTFIIIIISSGGILYIITNLIYCKAPLCQLQKNKPFSKKEFLTQLYKSNNQPDHPDEYDPIYFLDKYYSKNYNRSTINRPNSTLPLYYTYHNEFIDYQRIYCSPTPYPTQGSILDCYKSTADGNQHLDKHVYTLQSSSFNTTDKVLSYPELDKTIADTPITDTQSYQIKNLKCVDNNIYEVDFAECQGIQKFDDTLRNQTKLLYNRYKPNYIGRELTENKVYAMLLTYGYNKTDNTLLNEQNNTS